MKKQTKQRNSKGIQMNKRAMNDIKSLTNAGIIRPTSDKHDCASYTFFEIVGIDATKIRLAVWTGSDAVVWSLAGHDARDLWFSLGDRPDLKLDYEFESSSWRGHTCKKLRGGFATPRAWVKAISKKYNA